ncbi:MAG TPA: hypothetical protein VG370_27045, partial [Chloroflexota bacterium]|nr:hypothetical protein [Chloroflexota bacterium]
GAVDRIKANLPGLAETLPPRYDVLGEPTERQPLEALLPFSITRRSDDPTVRELERLRTTRDPATGETIGRSVTRLSRTLRQGGRMLALDGAEYAEAQRRFGTELKRTLDEVLAQDSYRRLSDAEKARTIGRIVTDVRDRVEEGTIAGTGAETAGRAGTPPTVTRALVEAGVALPAPPKTVSRGNVKNVPLTLAEQAEYRRITGDRISDLAQKYLDNPAWAAASREEKAAEMKALVRAARDAAELAVLEKMGVEEARQRVARTKAK